MGLLRQGVRYSLGSSRRCPCCQHTHNHCCPLTAHPCPASPRARAPGPCPRRQQGVEVLGQEQEGRPFDPALHEAVMRQPPPPGFSDDSVVKVLRAGYAVGGKLVRAALVIVAQE